MVVASGASWTVLWWLTHVATTMPARRVLGGLLIFENHLMLR